MSSPDHELKRMPDTGSSGAYAKDAAETRALQVNRHARQNKHSLLCETEEI